MIVKCLKSDGRGRRKKSTEQGTDLAKTYKGCPGTVVTDMTVCGSGLRVQEVYYGLISVTVVSISWFSMSSFFIL